MRGDLVFKILDALALIALMQAAFAFAAAVRTVLLPEHRVYNALLILGSAWGIVRFATLVLK